MIKGVDEVPIRDATRLKATDESTSLLRHLCVLLLLFIIVRVLESEF